MVRAVGAELMRPVRLAGGDQSGHTALFPVCHSLLAPGALVEEVLAAYDVGRVEHCRMYMRNLSDTYFVRTDRARYALRVYRTGWRTDGEIRYELDAIEHLAAHGIAVSRPVVACDGDPLRIVWAPEGRRQIVLFTFAEGKEAVQDDAGARLYGRVAAEMHAATEGWTSPHAHARAPIDLDELLERPLAAMAELFAERPKKERVFLQAQAQRLRERVAALPPERLEAGWCFGDFHGGNACIDSEAITFFDFDLCGHGWRSYDVAVFRWGHTGGWLPEKKAEGRWQAFLEGYASRRQLAPFDLAAVPLFVVLRQYWFMGLVCANAPDRGFWWPLRSSFFPGSIKVLKQWEKKLDTPVRRL